MNMESSTEERAFPSISQSDFITFLKEKQIDINSSNSETMFESFLVFQRFMSLMFKKPASNSQSEKHCETKPDINDNYQTNPFPLTEEANSPAEKCQQMQNNNTVENIHDYFKEKDNGNGNHLSLETQQDIKNTESHHKDKEHRPPYLSYDDIPIKPSTINFVELVEKNLAELQYQSEPRKDKGHSREKKPVNSHKGKPLKSRVRSNTVKEKEKKKQSSSKQSTRRSPKGEEDKSIASSMPKLSNSPSSRRQVIKSEIKEAVKAEEEEERPSVLPRLIQDDIVDEKPKDEEEYYLSRINRMEAGKEKIMPVFKQEDVLTLEMDDKERLDEGYEIDELLPEENHKKEHIEYVDLSHSDSLNIILPIYENYDSMENHNTLTREKDMKKREKEEENQSDSDDIIVNCDSENEEDSIQNEGNMKVEKEGSDKQQQKLIEEKMKDEKTKQDTQTINQLPRQEVKVPNDKWEKHSAGKDKMNTEERPKQSRAKPLSFSNLTPPIAKLPNHQSSIQSQKDKEQIEQLKGQIHKLQEEHKIKESKSKMTIEKLTRQLQEANSRLSEYIRLEKGNSKKPNITTNNNIKPHNSTKATNNQYNSNSIDNAEYNTNSTVKKGKSKQTAPKKKHSDSHQLSSNLRVVKVDNSSDETYELHFPSKYNLSSKDVVISEESTKDGRKVKSYSNNMREIEFASGVVKKIYEDGYQIIFFKNDDIKQIYPNGRSVYYFAESKVTQTILPNNLHIYLFPNGKIEKHYPNGKKEVIDSK